MNSNLTLFEARIADCLELTPKQLVRHSAIQDAVYVDKAPPSDPKSNSMEVLIGRLRKKGYVIKSTKGVGYTLLKSPDLPPASPPVHTNAPVEVNPAECPQEKAVT